MDADQTNKHGNIIEKYKRKFCDILSLTLNEKVALFCVLLLLSLFKMMKRLSTESSKQPNSQTHWFILYDNSNIITLKNVYKVT